MCQVVQGRSEFPKHQMSNHPTPKPRNHPTFRQPQPRIPRQKIQSTGILPNTHPKPKISFRNSCSSWFRIEKSQIELSPPRCRLRLGYIETLLHLLLLAGHRQLALGCLASFQPERVVTFGNLNASRSSGTEVRIRVPTFFCSLCWWGNPPPKRGRERAPIAGGPRHSCPSCKTESSAQADSVPKETKLLGPLGLGFLADGSLAGALASFFF